MQKRKYYRSYKEVLEKESTTLHVGFKWAVLTNDISHGHGPTTHHQMPISFSSGKHQKLF